LAPSISAPIDQAKARRRATAGALRFLASDKPKKYPPAIAALQGEDDVMRKILACFALAATLNSHVALAADPAKGPGLFAGATPLSATELSRHAGRGDVEPVSVGSALVEGNTVGSGSVTGGNNITGSLNNTGGFTTVFQNSGNNSLFQSVTTVNITLR